MRLCVCVCVCVCVADSLVAADARPKKLLQQREARRKLRHLLTDTGTEDDGAVEAALAAPATNFWVVVGAISLSTLLMAMGLYWWTSRQRINKRVA